MQPFRRYCQGILSLTTFSVRRKLKSTRAPPVLTTNKHKTGNL